MSIQNVSLILSIRDALLSRRIKITPDIIATPFAPVNSRSNIIKIYLDAIRSALATWSDTPEPTTWAQFSRDYLSPLDYPISGSLIGGEWWTTKLQQISDAIPKLRYRQANVISTLGHAAYRQWGGTTSGPTDEDPNEGIDKIWEYFGGVITSGYNGGYIKMFPRRTEPNEYGNIWGPWVGSFEIIDKAHVINPLAATGTLTVFAASRHESGLGFDPLGSGLSNGSNTFTAAPGRVMVIDRDGPVPFQYGTSWPSAGASDELWEPGYTIVKAYIDYGDNFILSDISD